MTQEEKTCRTKERILQAAMEEFGTKGYAAATIGAICSEHGIAKGLLYHNFTGKDALYLDCVSRCFDEVMTYLQGQEFGTDLQHYMECRFRYFSEFPLYAGVFFEAVLQPPMQLKEEIRERKKNFDQYNQCIYRTALAKMTLREGVSEKDALEYYGIMQEMFNGYFSSPAYTGKDLKILVSEHENRLSKILDFMLYGIVERRAKK